MKHLYSFWCGIALITKIIKEIMEIEGNIRKIKDDISILKNRRMSPFWYVAIFTFVAYTVSSRNEVKKEFERNYDKLKEIEQRQNQFNYSLF